MPAIIKAIGKSQNFPESMIPLRSGIMLMPNRVSTFPSIDPETEEEAMLTVHPLLSDMVTVLYIGDKAPRVTQNYLDQTRIHSTLSHQESDGWPLVHRGKVIAQLFVQHQGIQCLDIATPPLDYLPAT